MDYNWLSITFPANTFRNYIEDKLIEEMAELTQALIKFRNEPGEKAGENLIEELAHVEAHLHLYKNTALKHVPFHLNIAANRYQYHYSRKIDRLKMKAIRGDPHFTIP